MSSSPWSLEELDSLYVAARQCYESGDYKKASSLFKELAKAAPFEPPYWRGLASSEQMQKLYPEALHAWSVVAILQEQDPSVHFHAAECLISQGETYEAAKALDLAESYCGANDQELKTKINLLQTLYTY